MYARYEGRPVISRTDWLHAGLTWKQYRYDIAQGNLSLVGDRRPPLIDLTSIRRPERLAMIEAKFGPIERAADPVLKAEVDTEARAWYTAYRKEDGSPLEARLVEQYTNRASLLGALKRSLEVQRAERAKLGRKVKMGEWYEGAMAWYNGQREAGFPCAEIKNARSFERVFKGFCSDGYASVVSGKIDNDNKRLVSMKAKNLIVALWRTNGKPFKHRVWELYMEFVCGERELWDEATGEVYRPDDFRYKGRPLELSESTVWAYLCSAVDVAAVYADRNGQFAYQNSQRPKQVRKLGQYSLSKISMDDAALSRKTTDDKWVYKYLAVDVLSGYWFRPAYKEGKANEALVMESFRNMFRELYALGLPIPGELEVEHHLMKDIEWLNRVFPFVRFCASPTEKRAEHKIRGLKYGESKNEGHTVGRWYARSEAYRGNREKSDGDYKVPTAEKGTLIADDLADIEAHNNAPHPKGRLFPGMTRKEVLLKTANPGLKAIEPWYLLRWIGNRTETSIVNNNLVQVQYEKFWLSDFGSLGRLKPNSKKVEAYWLPEADGSIKTLYLYQGESYIGEAENMEKWRYNEFAIERTAEDEAGMQEQMKRVAKFDRMIKERHAELPKVGGWRRQEKSGEDWEAVAASVEVVECDGGQPSNYDDGEGYEAGDYAAKGYETV